MGGQKTYPSVELDEMNAIFELDRSPKWATGLLDEIYDATWLRIETAG